MTEIIPTVLPAKSKSGPLADPAYIQNNMTIAFLISHNDARKDGTRDVEEDTIRLVLVMQNSNYYCMIVVITAR